MVFPDPQEEFAMTNLRGSSPASRPSPTPLLELFRGENFGTASLWNPLLVRPPLLRRLSRLALDGL